MRGMRTISFDAAQGAVVLIDQTRLPRETHLVVCRTVEDVAEAIRSMRIRGAPAIGVAAAYGLALAAREHADEEPDAFLASLEQAARFLTFTRPTAVNLRWALDRSLARARRALEAEEVPANEGVHSLGAVSWACAELLRLAEAMADEDVETNRRMGSLGRDLVPSGATVLTHCNTGALATVDYGTALGVIRAAHESGTQLHVLVDETRPFLQGARLTAWELQQLGVPMTLITDNMAGHFMSRGKVDLVLVGADRIAANGDVANKIGTYSLAVLAHEHNIPFYVVAPTSTIDLSLASGADIPIEERSSEEVLHVAGVPTAPEGVQAAHPAFDVTPARLVTAIVTERGVLRPPYQQSLAEAVRGAAVAAQ
jgi:methylthioribose-1-phosphate isomerase